MYFTFTKYEILLIDIRQMFYISNRSFSFWAKNMVYIRKDFTMNPFCSTISGFSLPSVSHNITCLVVHRLKLTLIFILFSSR